MPPAARRSASYPRSLHAALPISASTAAGTPRSGGNLALGLVGAGNAETLSPLGATYLPDYTRIPSLFDPLVALADDGSVIPAPAEDRKSTRLNSSHANNSYATCCAPQRQLPSFPTRRSSDLRVDGRRDAQERRQPGPRPRRGG